MKITRRMVLSLLSILPIAAISFAAKSALTLEKTGDKEEKSYLLAQESPSRGGGLGAPQIGG